MSMRRMIMILTLLSLALPVAAQERKLVRKGNELYEQKKYPEAAKAYQQALQKSPQFLPGVFNLGNALHQQKQYEAARKAYDQTAGSAKNPSVQGGAFYNKGNTYMSEQKWKEAVEAYKQSLRRQPDDAAAKYNLSYALAKLKQQEQQDKNDKQDKNDQQNENKKDPKDGKDGKEGDEQQKRQEGDGQDQQPQRPQPQPSKLSEQQAENLLKALQQDERKVQDKMQQGKGMPVKVEKDW